MAAKHRPSVHLVLHMAIISLFPLHSKLLPSHHQLHRIKAPRVSRNSKRAPLPRLREDLVNNWGRIQGAFCKSALPVPARSRPLVSLSPARLTPRNPSLA